MSGIILPDMGEPTQLMRRAAELLAHLNAASIRPEDVELLPYIPPEHDRIRFDPKAA